MAGAGRLAAAASAVKLARMPTDNKRIALVAGANGLVGTALLRELLDSGEYARVIALTRRPLRFESPRLVNRILRFAALETEMQGLQCQDAFCCLGTTRHAAGSAAAFRAVDHELILAFARGAYTAGARTLLVVSAVGADPAARNFYLRTKGETETALEVMRWRALHLFQPGLLLGPRAERRPLEALARWVLPVFNPLLLGRLQRWRAISARQVAAAMRAAALSARLGTQRYTWAQMRQLARATRTATRM